jgi:hypothetical protein
LLVARGRLLVADHAAGAVAPAREKTTWFLDENHIMVDDAICGQIR